MALTEKQMSSEKVAIEARKNKENQYDVLYHGDEEESIELDVIEQLRANLNHLSDLQKRLQFMNSELHSLIAPRK